MVKWLLAAPDKEEGEENKHGAPFKSKLFHMVVHLSLSPKRKSGCCCANLSKSKTQEHTCNRKLIYPLSTFRNEGLFQTAPQL
jgi:hypothetical protein